MKVVILCGGKGTRLKEKTESIPKPLIDIGGRPILWHIMKVYSSFGFDDFILCLGYKGQAIKEYFMQYASWKHQDFKLDLSAREPGIDLINHDCEKWKITFVDTGLDTNTGGRIKRVASLINPSESFMVTYGDGLADIDINQLVSFHHAHEKIGTVTIVKPQLQFGLLDIDERGKVTRFTEKPILDRWINGGFFVFRPEFLEMLRDGDVLEQTPLERLAADNQLMAFRHESYWKCMDTFKDSELLNEQWVKNDAPWKTW